jgi:hypothetical protein
MIMSVGWYVIERCNRLGGHTPHVWYTNGCTLDLDLFARWCDG